MKSITVKLDDPIKVSGKETSEITLTKPTVRDMRAAKTKGGEDVLERTLVMIGDLAGLAPEEINQISLTDLDKINEELVKANFIPAEKTAPKS